MVATHSGRGYFFGMTAIRGRLIALAALLALSISQAHQVWSLCCLVEQGPAAVEVVGGDVHAAHRATSSGAPHVSPTPAAPHHAPTPECPPGQAARLMSGCAVVAAVPAVAAVTAATPLAHDAPPLPSITMPRLLLGEDLFRPPRA